MALIRKGDKIMKNSEVNKLLKKYEPVVKKTGKQMSKIAKSAEEDITKIYKIAHTYVEMQMKNLQKEKLYHEIGKNVAGKLLSGKLDMPELDKYKRRLSTINLQGSKMKKKMEQISKSEKTKAAPKKK